MAVFDHRDWGRSDNAEPSRTFLEEDTCLVSGQKGNMALLGLATKERPSSASRLQLRRTSTVHTHRKDASCEMEIMLSFESI